jgi:hypothetical protein
MLEKRRILGHIDIGRYLEKLTDRGFAIALWTKNFARTTIARVQRPSNKEDTARRIQRVRYE